MFYTHNNRLCGRTMLPKIKLFVYRARIHHPLTQRAGVFVIREKAWGDSNSPFPLTGATSKSLHEISKTSLIQPECLKISKEEICLNLHVYFFSTDIFIQRKLLTEIEVKFRMEKMFKFSSCVQKVCITMNFKLAI